MNLLSKISVVNVIGTLCVSADDGQILHDKIAQHIRSGGRVEVSFAGVETLISAFLNAAIGQLYGEFSEDTISKLLTVDGLAIEDAELLERVEKNAKVYFENRRSYDDAWKAEIKDE